MPQALLRNPLPRFINNCAGAANLRHFILFLAYLAAGVAYGLALALAMGWHDRAAVVGHTRRVLQVGTERGGRGNGLSGW